MSSTSKYKWRFYLLTSVGMSSFIVVLAFGFLYLAYEKQWEAINWVYSKGGHVGVKGSQYYLMAPMCSEVINVDIKGAKIHNLRILEKLPELNWLELEQCQIKDFDGLEKLPKLKELSLYQTNLKNLSQLGSIEKLESLNIRGTTISDLRGLESFANLKTLDIRQIPAKDYSPLLNLPRLIFLRIDQSVLRGKKGKILMKLRRKGVAIMKGGRDEGEGNGMSYDFEL